MSDVIRKQAEALGAAVNESLKDTAPWKIVLGTAGASLTVAYIYSQIGQKVRLSLHD